MSEEIQEISDAVEPTRFTRVKTKIKENKGAVITGIICLTVGAAIGFIARDKIGVKGIQINLFSPHAQNIMQTILERKGHPGYVVRCIETGKKFASQGDAARKLGISPAALSSHLNGKTASVSGMTFERLGEATTT